jgi:hypothetical protein
MIAVREGNRIRFRWLKKDNDFYILDPGLFMLRKQVQIVRAEEDLQIIGSVERWIGQPPPIRK